jgi:hypothetical protein
VATVVQRTPCRLNASLSHKVKAADSSRFHDIARHAADPSAAPERRNNAFPIKHALIVTEYFSAVAKEVLRRQQDEAVPIHENFAENAEYAGDCRAPRRCAAICQPYCYTGR